MKNTIYILITVSLYFLTTYNCQAQFDPVDYDLYIQNDVYADQFDTAATVGNLIAVNTIFSEGVANYYATGTTLKEGFTVEKGGTLFLSIPITGKKKTNTQLFTTKDTNFTLYPNPTTRALTITLKTGVWNSDVRAEVYTLNSSTMVYSEEIQQKNASKATLNVSSLPKGIYVLKVYEKKGSKSFVQKFIKN
ncbi:T9SS type A sorting domain-containing protein [Kordia sp.]|uniref:T9SS type A sorting domain-containing protein n=1 Tax=Kordia sp. TaxID=1965332 RepID=UPI003B5AFE93